MYEAHWQLSHKPFENVSDPRFYYPSDTHQGTLLKLRYAVEQRRGGAILCGAAGLGKSMLARTLLRQLASDFQPRIHLVFPQMPADQLVAYLADELAGHSIDSGNTNVQSSVRRIRDFLSHNTRSNRHAVIVIDESHLLADNKSLEAIRLLLNFETDAKHDLTLLLVGQPQLLANMDKLPGLEERIGVKCLVRPFTMEETVSYINHRLTAAEANRPIFDNGAMEAVHHLSFGIPRRVNRLCDLALLIGYADHRDQINAENIEGVADEMVTVSPE